MSDRVEVCDGCHGRIQIPKGRRTFTLEQIVANHKTSCPARGVQHKKEEPE